MACTCDSYLNKEDTVRKFAGKQKKIEAGKRTIIVVQYPASDAKKTKEAVETRAKKTYRKSQEQRYKVLPAFLDTSKVSVFKKKINSSFSLVLTCSKCAQFYVYGILTRFLRSFERCIGPQSAGCNFRRRLAVYL